MLYFFPIIVHRLKQFFIRQKRTVCPERHVIEAVDGVAGEWNLNAALLFALLQIGSDRAVALPWREIMSGRVCEAEKDVFLGTTWKVDEELIETEPKKIPYVQLFYIPDFLESRIPKTSLSSSPKMKNCPKV